MTEYGGGWGGWSGRKHFGGGVIVEPEQPTVSTARQNRPRRPTLDEAFSPRHNSLNFLRLVLALTVVLSHAVLLGGFGKGDIFNRSTTLGTAAVYGFFGISGYLIAGSACRNNAGRYLWQRFLRILPGFWVCLLVTAFLIGVIAWSTTSHPLTCGLQCYANAPQGPFDYVYHDWLLLMRQGAIAKTPLGVPQPGDWNGSLWTLFFEFLCYIMLGGLALLGILRRRAVVAWLTLALWLTSAARTLDTHLFGSFSVLTLQALFAPNSNYFTNQNFIEMKLFNLTSIFLVGTVLYLYRDKVPDSGLLALGCSAVFLVGILVPFGGPYGFFSMTGADLLAPAIAYPLLWLGIHLPFQRVGARNDYSYGVYIYAYPIQQLLAIWHVQRWGFPTYLLLSVVCVAPFAFASWWIVERPALKLKQFDLPAALKRLKPASAEQPTAMSEPSSPN
jgi:peptidoglycan/LPS O-acetylase OafA/YrhL